MSPMGTEVFCSSGIRFTPVPGIEWGFEIHVAFAYSSCPALLGPDMAQAGTGILPEL